MLSVEEQIKARINKAKNILICFPPDGNGDAMSSGLAFGYYLKSLGKETDIACARHPQDNPRLKKLSFLSGFQSILTQVDNLRSFIVSLDIKSAKVNQIKYKVEKDTLNFIISPSQGWFSKNDVRTSASGFKYDLIVTIGATDLESLGEIYDKQIEFFFKTDIINLDNSPANEEFGQINLVDLSALSLAEIIFFLIKHENDYQVKEDLATCLLAGIISATNNFKSPKLSPQTLFSASKLISLGGHREEISGSLFRSKDIKTLKLWGRLLQSLETEPRVGFVAVRASKEDFEITKTQPDDLPDIIDELIANIPELKLAALFYQEPNGHNAALLYSLRNINCLEIAKNFSPTGSVKLAKIENDQENLEQWQKQVTENILLKLEKLNL